LKGEEAIKEAEGTTASRLRKMVTIESLPSITTIQKRKDGQNSNNNRNQEKSTRKVSEENQAK